MSTHQHIEIQGHRGARGLFPENTISAFLEAVKWGVDAIEMDVVISKDHQVVVSHEPWMSALYCTKPNGEAVEKELEESYNLYQMDYAEIAQFDCGIKGNELFPTQQKIAARKPLLSEVIKAVEKYTITHNLPAIKYSIEIKTEINGDDLFHPAPETFVHLVYEEIKNHSILNRTIIMSFDVSILQALKRMQVAVPLSYLIENTDSLSVNLDRLGFIPAIYGPEFILITDQLISDLKNKNITLITWTVNEPEDMTRLIDMGVTTLITDYPNKAINLLKQRP